MIAICKIFEALFPYTPIAFSQAPIPATTATNLTKNEIMDEREKERQKRQAALIKNRQDANKVAT